MSQTGDYNIANASGSTVRQDITDTFANVLSSNSGSGAPSYQVAGTLFYSTHGDTPYLYFSDGSAWHPIVKINGNGFFSATDASTSVEISTTGSIELHSGIATDSQGNAATPFIDFKRDSGADTQCRIIQSADAKYDLEIKTGGSVAAFKTTQFKGDGGVVLHGATQGKVGQGIMCARGYNTRTGYDTDSGNSNAASTNSDNIFNFWWDTTTSDAYFFIDNTRLGHIDASTTSDYRIKREITTLDINGIDRVKQLRPVSYKYTDYEIFKSSEVVHEGFIAHEVGEVIADACKGEKDKNLQSIGLAPLVATLTKALQEAVAKIETLETKVAALEAK